MFPYSDWIEFLSEKAVEAESIDATFMVTDPQLPDNPIVFLNPAFERHTGYRRGRLLNRNCRILQGPDTDPGAVDEIRAAVAAERPATVDLLNYRADGTAFWNRITIQPVSFTASRRTAFWSYQEQLQKPARCDAGPRADRGDAFHDRDLHVEEPVRSLVTTGR